MFNRLASNMIFQREAGAFLSTASSAQKRKYRYYAKKGYTHRQSIQLAKGNYRIR